VAGGIDIIYRCVLFLNAFAMLYALHSNIIAVVQSQASSSGRSDGYGKSASIAAIVALSAVGRIFRTRLGNAWGILVSEDVPIPWMKS